MTYYTPRSSYEYISQQTSDPIVEWKTCTLSQSEFPIYQSDLDFYHKLSPSFDGQKFSIPTPNLCPEERQKRRLAFRNERKLYRRTCDATGETMISFISPDKSFPVYHRRVWFSDQYDPLKFGMEFDFSKTFTENFQALSDITPRYSMQQWDPMENSDYCNFAASHKNCYYTFDSDYLESCYFCNVAKNSSYCTDCGFIDECEVCYNCNDCIKCYKLLHSNNCSECSDSYYLTNCTLCRNCFDCSNLSNRQYCIQNQQYSKEEYFEKIQQLLTTGDTYHQDMINLQQGTHNHHTEASYGNYINQAKHSYFVHSCGDVDTVKYSDLLYKANWCYDVSSFGEGIQYCYDSVTVGLGCSSVLFSNSVVKECSNIYYSNIVFGGSTNCFGCIGLKANEYCILNKQYSKEEYETMVAKIITHMQTTGEWGEFLNPSVSQFGYNETVANEYYPLTQSQAQAQGYKWNDYSSDPVIPAGVQTIEKKNHNDTQWKSLKETDDVLKQIFICEVSGRPYRIVKQELEFYRKHDLAIPSKHPDVRHEERMKLRPGRTLHLRTCDCCSSETLSVYGQDYEGKIYCESCYQKEIFG